MTSVIELHTEPLKQLSVAGELNLLGEALARSPRSPTLRNRMARLLNKRDAFDRTIEMLSAGPLDELDPVGRQVLAQALFARSGSGDDALAAQILFSALTPELDDHSRAQILADLAKANLRLDQADAALGFLREALALDPANQSAFKRLAWELLRGHQAGQVIAMTDRLMADGVRHSRLLAARMMALAAEGQPDAARELAGVPQFLHSNVIAAPGGWASLADFNQQIVSEIMANPDLRFGRHGTASLDSWRIDDPVTNAAPGMRALLALIAERIGVHLQADTGNTHPWLAMRPARATLKCWCVITQGNGHEQWHTHPDGWLSGGYYPEVPGTVVDGHDAAGCFEIGLPDGLIGTDAAKAFGTTLVRPQPGLLTLFPSHTYHRTHPHRADGRRICIAFDVCPG